MATRGDDAEMTKIYCPKVHIALHYEDDRQICPESGEYCTLELAECEECENILILEKEQSK